MASGNVRSGNTVSFLNTGLVAIPGNQSVTYIVITGTGASANVSLADGTTNVRKITLAAPNLTSLGFDFSGNPITFLGGINAISLSNCVVTVVLKGQGA